MPFRRWLKRIFTRQSKPQMPKAEHAPPTPPSQLPPTKRRWRRKQRTPEEQMSYEEKMLTDADTEFERTHEKTPGSRKHELGIKPFFSSTKEMVQFRNHATQINDYPKYAIRDLEIFKEFARNLEMDPLKLFLKGEKFLFEGDYENKDRILESLQKYANRHVDKIREVQLQYDLTVSRFGHHVGEFIVLLIREGLFKPQK